MHFCPDELMAIVSIAPDLSLILGLVRQRLRRTKVNAFEELRKMCDIMKEAAKKMQKTAAKMKDTHKQQTENIAKLDGINRVLKENNRMLQDMLPSRPQKKKIPPPLPSWAPHTSKTVH